MTIQQFIELFLPSRGQNITDMSYFGYFLLCFNATFMILSGLTVVLPKAGLDVIHLVSPEVLNSPTCFETVLNYRVSIDLLRLTLGLLIIAILHKYRNLIPLILLFQCCFSVYKLFYFSVDKVHSNLVIGYNLVILFFTCLALTISIHEHFQRIEERNKKNNDHELNHVHQIGVDFHSQEFA